MAVRHPKPRSNRYKKNGKGGRTLAVFLLLVCLLLAGIGLQQYFSHRQQQPAVPTTPRLPSASPPATVLQQPRSSAAQHPAATAAPAIEPVPLAKQEPYYTGDPHPDHTPPAIATPPPVKPGSKAELAILVDDMGSSLQEAQALAAIGVPISFAIIPGLRSDRQVASFAAEQGIEILLHLPMQSREYPRRRLEANGLLLEHSDDETRNRLLSYIALVPGAVGANNHMGSGFTEHAGKMRVVLGILKEHNLFFIDSVTSPQTTGLKVAAELQLRHARRDVFLDNEQQEGYIRGQLQQAVARARRQGQAIAICHPHPVTIATLRKLLPGLADQKISLVPVSRLVR